MSRFAYAALAATVLIAATPSTAPDPEHYLDQFMDKSVSPREDFFHYSVGKWLREHPIPKSERSWGVSDVIQEETYQRLLDLNKAASSAKSQPGSNQQKIGDFWFAAMDTLTIAKQGFAPLDSELARINAIKDLPSLAAVVARLQYIGVGPLYSSFIIQDEKNSDRYAVHLGQGGLGLPDRDYYFDADDRAKMLRREYVTHVGRMLRLLGDDAATATKHASTIMAMETELARASRKLEDLRDPIRNYNALSLDALGKLTPSIQWRAHLADAKVTGIDTVIVGQPEFFQQVEKSLHAHSIGDWKTYLRWQLANAFATEAGGHYDAEHFRFYGTILNGTLEQRPRWKRMLDEEEAIFLDMFGDPATNPRAWPSAVLGDAIASASDGPHVSPSYSQSGVPFLSTRHIRPGRIYWNDLKFISAADAAVHWKKCRPQLADVLYTEGGTTGLAAAVRTDKPFAIWVHVALLRPNHAKVDPVWLESMLNLPYCYQQSQVLTHGIANRDLGLTRMVRIKMYVPPLELQRQFVHRATTIENLRVAHDASLAQLDALFASLQHRAFNGEL